MIKYIFVFITVFTLTQISLFAQKKKPVVVEKLSGLWRTDHLIGDERENEFYLCSPEIMPCPKPYKVPIQPGVVPGKTISFNADGTFKSEYTDGDEKLLRLTGSYQFVNDKYVRFKVDTFVYKGIEKPRVKVEQDTSLFYIHREGDIYKLFRSEGDINQDKQNVFYSNIISPIRCDAPSPTDEKSKLIWHDVDGRDRDFAIECCLSAYDITDYKFVYQQRTGLMRVYMVEIDGYYRFLIHHPFRKTITLDTRKIAIK